MPSGKFKTWRVDYAPTSPAELSVPTAQRAERKALVRRKVTVGRQVYVAISAHDLIEADSEANPSRPGLIR